MPNSPLEHVPSATILNRRLTAAENYKTMPLLGRGEGAILLKRDELSQVASSFDEHPEAEITLTATVLAQMCRLMVAGATSSGQNIVVLPTSVAESLQASLYALPVKEAAIA